MKEVVVSVLLCIWIVEIEVLIGNLYWKCPGENETFTTACIQER